MCGSTEKMGGVDVFEFEPHEWIWDRSVGHDVAVVPIQVTQDHSVQLVGTPLLVTREMREEHEITIGDDIFMIGRFMDDDGNKVNRPSVRFGSISIEEVTTSTEGLNKATSVWCLDTNTRTGYSGSPVFVYRNHTTDLLGRWDYDAPAGDLSKGHILMESKPLVLLLGIHQSQFPEWIDFETRQNPARKVSDEVVGAASESQIRQMSGMTLCAPAWALDDLMSHDRILKYLDEEEAKIDEANLPKEEF